MCECTPFPPKWRPCCSICIEWSEHHEKVTNVRELYKLHSKNNGDIEHVIVSADLQKVIMLTRMDSFKTAIFTRKIIAFNESFVPLGNSKVTNVKPLAVIWHEGIAGRKQEELNSTFYKFLILNRDAPKITIWLDNCTSQNKNWYLLTFLIYIINYNEIRVSEINFFYLKSGHTFMSADSFQNQVELSIKKKKGKLYDFKDFTEAVSNANSGKTNVKVMSIYDFSLWTSECSVHKFRKQEIRPFLNNIVHIKATRGNVYLLHSTNCNTFYPLQKLGFLKKNVLKKV